MGYINMVKETLTHPNYLLIALPYIIGFITALSLFWWREFCRKRDIQSALKYEIFSNAYEFIDLIRVAENSKDRAQKNEYPLRSIIYSEPRFNAFDAMISNALSGAIKKSNEETSLIYSIFREYDTVFKRKIATIDNILSDYSLKGLESMTAFDQAAFFKYGLPAYIFYCDEIIIWATTFKKSYKEKFLKVIDFLSEREWKSFVKTMGAQKEGLNF